MKKALTFLAAILFAASAQAAQPVQTGDVAVKQEANDVRFTIVTNGGYVRFTVDANLKVIAMQSRPPITVSAFFIPDSADEGSRNSTNMAISLFTPGAPQAENALAAIGRPRGAGPVTTENRNEWTVYRQTVHQGDILYTVLDAKAAKADVICGVRLAWPHLQGHTSDYDVRMESLFNATLASISGGVGVYEAQEGEIVRHPDPN